MMEVITRIVSGTSYAGLQCRINNRRFWMFQRLFDKFIL